MSAYARLRRQHIGAIAMHVVAEGIRARGLSGVRFGFEWLETDRRRDPDGISAAGRKLILDALKPAHRTTNPCGLGLIHCDGQHCIDGFDGDEFILSDRPAVRVRCHGADGAFLFSVVLPLRLPDENEMLAAARLDALAAASRRQRWSPLPKGGREWARRNRKR